MRRSFTKIAEGIPGSEGPCFDKTERFFMVCPNRGEVLRLDDDGKLEVWADTGGIPAGLQCDRENNLWVADMQLGILTVAPDRHVEHVVDEFEGQPMRGCNDCIFDSKGNLYLTAPAGSGADQAVGELFCYTAEGRIRRLDKGYRFPNGIALTADDRTLIVAETFGKLLWAFDVRRPGEVSNRRLWAKLPDDPNSNGPDGMDFDEAGNLLVTHHGAGTIDVFSSDAKLVARVECPFSQPSNVHFGGEGGNWVYVTEHQYNGLWKFKWDRPGQKLYCQR